MMVAFTGCDADIATRVTSMGDMTCMVFSLLRKHTVPASVDTGLSLSLPLAAHGDPTGIHYTGERSIFSLGGSGNGESMDFFGQGRNYQQSFSGFKVEATLEGEKLQMSSRKKERKESPAPYSERCVSARGRHCSLPGMG